MQMININGKCFNNFDNSMANAKEFNGAINKENNISIEINKEGNLYKGTFNGVPKNGIVSIIKKANGEITEVYLIDSEDGSKITFRINTHISKNDILSNSLYSLHCEENKYVLWEEINPLTN